MTLVVNLFSKLSLFSPFAPSLSTLPTCYLSVCACVVSFCVASPSLLSPSPALTFILPLDLSSDPDKVLFIYGLLSESILSETDTTITRPYLAIHK